MIFKKNPQKFNFLKKYIHGKMYIPRGFISDGGSIPRFFFRLFSPLDARYLRSYIQHDFIYATGLRDRKSADVLLRKGLEKARYEFYRQMGSLFICQTIWVVTLQNFQ